MFSFFLPTTGVSLPIKRSYLVAVGVQPSVAALRTRLSGTIAAAYSPTQYSYTISQISVPGPAIKRAGKCAFAQVFMYFVGYPSYSSLKLFFADYLLLLYGNKDYIVIYLVCDVCGGFIGLD